MSECVRQFGPHLRGSPVRGPMPSHVHAGKGRGCHQIGAALQVHVILLVGMGMACLASQALQVVDGLNGFTVPIKPPQVGLDVALNDLNQPPGQGPRESSRQFLEWPFGIYILEGKCWHFLELIVSRSKMLAFF